MPTYKNFTDAIKDLIIPLDRAGNTVKDSIKNTLFSNKANGKELKSITTKLKAQNKYIKLVEYGSLANATMININKNNVDIGYNNNTHKQDNNSKERITNASLAEVHNKGNNHNPQRTFLFENKEWLPQHKKAIEKFIKNYYQEKKIL